MTCLARSSRAGIPVLLDEVGRAGDTGVQRFAAALHQAVGVEQQGRPRRQRLAVFGPGPVDEDPEWRGRGAVEQLRGAVGLHHDRRRMPGAGVHQLTGVRAEHRAEGGGAARAGQPRGEPVERRQRGAWAEAVPAAARGRRFAAGPSRSPRSGRGRRSRRRSARCGRRRGRRRRTSHRRPAVGGWPAGSAPRIRRAGCAGPRMACLQRQRGLPLLVELVHPLQTLAEATGQHREQRVVFGGERSPLGQLDRTRRARRADAAARCPPMPGSVGVGGEQIAVARAP